MFRILNEKIELVLMNTLIMEKFQIYANKETSVMTKSPPPHTQHLEKTVINLFYFQISCSLFPFVCLNL